MSKFNCCQHYICVQFNIIHVYSQHNTCVQSTQYMCTVCVHVYCIDKDLLIFVCFDVFTLFVHYQVPAQVQNGMALLREEVKNIIKTIITTKLGALNNVSIGRSKTFWQPITDQYWQGGGILDELTKYELRRTFSSRIRGLCSSTHIDKTYQIAMDTEVPSNLIGIGNRPCYFSIRCFRIDFLPLNILTHNSSNTC